MEVHAHLLTASKIFCGCATAFGAPPNTQVCEVCLGMPGSLPVLNHKAVEFALKMALATNCRVNPESVFARKNYFYPDLPKGYQISQYELPLAEHGFLDIKVEGRARRIGITRIHMEEDAGKLIHSESRPVSFVDFNRTGVPLIEIVSEPDLRTPEEAVEYLKGLRNILLYLEICDGNMEEGSLRCDANISLRPEGQTEFGARAELKNMNSFRFVRAALEYEIKRQRALVSRGAGNRPGDPPVGYGRQPDRVHAGQGRGPRLPLLPRPGPSARQDRSRLVGILAEKPAGAAGGGVYPFSDRIRAAGIRRRGADLG